MNIFAPHVHRFACSAALFCLLLAGPVPPSLADGGKFVRVETATLDKEDFVFPDDLNATTLNVVMLAIGEDQDNGTWQGDALVEWYAALAAAGVLTDGVKAWHISVMKVPFFIKGLVRGGMADSYTGKLPLNQASALFVKDVAGFAAAAGVEVDGQPTIILVAADGEWQAVFKGELTDERLAAVVQAVEFATVSVPAEAAAVAE